MENKKIFRHILKLFILSIFFFIGVFVFLFCLNYYYLYKQTKIMRDRVKEKVEYIEKEANDFYKTGTYELNNNPLIESIIFLEPYGIIEKAYPIPIKGNVQEGILNNIPEHLDLKHIIKNQPYIIFYNHIPILMAYEKLQKGSIIIYIIRMLIPNVILKQLFLLFLFVWTITLIIDIYFFLPKL